MQNQDDNAKKMITITTQQRTQELQIRISDSASGITQSQMNNLFEPFYTSKESGLGMGLSISRTIIEAHGGSLRAESDGRCGSTFTISLPRQGHRS